MRHMTGANPAEPLLDTDGADEPFVLTEAVAPDETGSARVDEVEEYTHRRDWSWLPAALAIVAALGSFVGLGWMVLPSVQAGMPPVALVQLIAALCVPPLLIGLLYLLAMRTSRSEARRFG
ncbi:MAG: hypothetical protein EOP58_12090, partial [Sphingomonadales bacterium]